MPTKTIGHVLTGLGLTLILISFGLGYVGIGDQRLGASQLLGIVVGAVVLFVGIFFGFLHPNRTVNIRDSMQALGERLLNLPVIVWVMVGFAIVYVWLFLFYAFLNPEHTMRYFNRFLPDRYPIGLDIRAVMKYIEAWTVSGQSPYADGFIAYPPLFMVLFAPLLLLAYPAYYYLITVVTLVLYAGSAVLPSLFQNPGQGNSLPPLLFILSLFSYGFQFELERGQSNIIAYSLCLIGIYLFHAYPQYRYIAYFLFVIGVQIKIYPLILLIMFVEDWKDWKSNIKRFVGILLVNFVLLFILGFPTFIDFIHALTGQQLYGESWNGNHSLQGFVYHITSENFDLFPQNVLMILQEYRSVVELLFLAMLATCFLAVLIHSYVQNKPGPNPYLLFVCTICALVIPSISNDYKLPILTIPMACLFVGITLPEQRFRRVISIGLIILISVAYWSTQYPFTAKPPIVDRNFPALFILIIAATILNFVVNSRDKLPVDHTFSRTLL